MNAVQRPRFCRQCGAALDVDARFCGECGTAVALMPAGKGGIAGARQHPAAPDHAPALQGDGEATTAGPLGRLRSRPALLAGIAAGVAVVAVAAGAILWLSPKSASSERFAPIINDYLKTLPATFGEATLCDRRIGYDQRIEIDAFDTRRKVLDQLVPLGVYQPAQLKSVGDGWATRTHLIFIATPNASTSIHDGTLCAATGYAVSSVTLADNTETLGDITYLQVQAQLKWRDPVAWAQDPGLAKALPGIQPERTLPLMMARERGNWRVLRDEERPGQLRQAGAVPAVTAGGGGAATSQAAIPEADAVRDAWNGSAFGKLHRYKAVKLQNCSAVDLAQPGSDAQALAPLLGEGADPALRPAAVAQCTAELWLEGGGSIEKRALLMQRAGRWMLAEQYFAEVLGM
ncbi:hypothetical protein IGB42_02560 [Andreprevotia sp. IGB-42]|uniref:zinc ribbon domain-containing protein n=1 Tax=Andreprevotia sp. IGB-42 TaxID=2497473 RepID=UPI00135A89B2|nr:zinc ribbon domain-containing protein [Andreprevotia sp. IGB-42]KAF0812720.1 hypothetical protein IGB42_02560 [Andreprevotia sp. IGB-42]